MPEAFCIKSGKSPNLGRIKAKKLEIIGLRKKVALWSLTFEFINTPSHMIDKDFVFSRIGMALISTQRVEYVASQLLSHLKEFDEGVYGITGPQFLAKSKKANLARATLGKIFTLLKLTPKLVIEEELNEYLAKRNLLVHGFWQNYLDSYSADQAKRAVDFCYDFGRQSEKLESFFKGFIFFLGLRHVENIDKMNDELRSWKNDFDYFMSALHFRNLQNNS